MIKKEVIKNELYVWIYEKGLKQLLYKRWINRGFGVVMDRQPFTAKDTELFKKPGMKIDLYNIPNKNKKQI